MLPVLKSSQQPFQEDAKSTAVGGNWSGRLLFPERLKHFKIFYSALYHFTTGNNHFRKWDLGTDEGFYSEMITFVGIQNEEEKK